MKKERKSRNLNKNLYAKLDASSNIRDKRYWGMFLNGAKGKKVKIDPKRFQKMTRITFREDQLKIINSRKTHYFFPRKIHRKDYNCNIFAEEISDIKEYWFKQFKGLINRELDRIKKPPELYPGDYYNLQCGISGAGAAQAWANWQNIKNQQDYCNKCAVLVANLYAQFLHYMTARIEAITVKVLTRNKVIKDKFDRNIFYNTCPGKEKQIKEMEHFIAYDKLYCIWNFIKHNSYTTFKTLNDRYPELICDADEYRQGNLAIYYLKFSNSLVEDLLNGLEKFYKEYCSVVYKEDYDEAQWNYADFFSQIVYDEIENLENPLGLEWWDELD